MSKTEPSAPGGLITGISLEPSAKPLLQAVWPQVQDGLAGLPQGPAVSVGVGDIPGFYAIEGERVVLSERLLGPQVHHPAEPRRPAPLDRWRRGVASALEGVVLVALARASDRPVDTGDWRWVGLAAELVDSACPGLQLGLGAMVSAGEQADPGRDPRQGLAVYRAIRRGGDDPWTIGRSWIAGQGPSAARWLALGRWVLGPALAAEVGVPVDLAPAVDAPVTLPRWSWRRIEVPAHPRGGWIRTDGGAHIEEPWAAGGQPLKTLAGALASGGTLIPVTAGPVGVWEHVSARGWGQLFGIRGMRWTFHGDGRLQMMLTDSVAGPVGAHDVADGVGTSGVVPGRWAIAGERRLILSNLVTSRLTMHGKGAQGFALPAGGLSQVIQAMSGGVWRWRTADGELYLKGPMMGGEVELRFRPAAQT